MSHVYLGSCHWRFLAIAFVTLCLGATARAQTVSTSTWDGGGANNNWSTAANWVGDAALTETSNFDRNFVFDGTTRLGPNFDSASFGGLSGGFNVRGINFPSTAGAFILTESANAGLDMLGDRNVGVAATISNNSTSTQTLSIILISRADFTSTLQFDTVSGNIAVTKGISGNSATTGNITKTGAQTLTLSAANTYGGTTTVSAGTLVLSGSNARLGAATNTNLVRVSAGSISILAGVTNGIADGATLRLDGGGTASVADTGFISLASGITETVGGLSLNGVLQPFGTYGSTASTATFQSDEYFSGAGVLNVIPEPASGVLLLAAASMMSLRRRRR